jgi:hypothetical protein
MKIENFPFYTEKFIKQNHLQLTPWQSQKLRERLPRGIYWLQIVDRGMIHWNYRLLADYLIRGDRPEHQALIESYLDTLPTAV